MVRHLPDAVFPCHHAGAWLAVLLLSASCEPGSLPSPLPRLTNAEDVDPSLRERLDGLVAAAERDEPGALVSLARTYDANGLVELSLATYECLPSADRDAQVWYHMGRLRAMCGQVSGALDALDRVVALDPTYAPTHWRRGELLLELDRLQEAEGAFRLAVQLEPGGLQGSLGQARVQLARGDAATARDLLTPLAESQPRARFLHGLLARALFQCGDADGARQAMRREERARETTVLDPWTAALEPLAVGLLVTVERANEALLRGDPEQALALLEPLDAERPGELTVQQLLARALLDAGRSAEATELLDRARALHPEQYKLELFSGQAALAQGAFSRAAVHLERAASLNPSYGPTQAALGEALLALQRHREAEVALELAVQSGSEGLRVLLLLARAQRGSGALERARETLAESAQLFRRAAEPWAELCELELEAGNPGAAGEALRAAAERDLPLARQRKLGRKLEEALAAAGGATR